MKTTTRRLRAELARTLARAARGEEITVTRRGKPYVRVIAAGPAAPTPPALALRGSVRRIADDFDAPMTDAWESVEW